MQVPIHIDIFFPIVNDRTDEDFPFEERDRIVSDLKEVISSDLTIEEEYIENFSVNFEVDSNQPPSKIYEPEDRILFNLQEACLHFSISVNVNIGQYILQLQKWNPDSKFNERDYAELLIHTVVHDFGQPIFELLVLSQIARPGSLKIRKGTTWINNQRNIHTLFEVVNVREAIKHTSKLGYPIVQFLNFADFYNWLKKNNLIFNDKNENPYQKAINQFSYLCGRPMIKDCILHMVAALEKLYTSSNQQVREQLHKKIQIYLGPHQANKKPIKEMYDVRSGFAHGGMTLKAMHKQVFDEPTKYEKKLEDIYHLSVMIIIATLQKMYQEDRTELNFEWQLVD